MLFGTSPAAWKICTAVPGCWSLPGASASFVRLSAFFPWADFCRSKTAKAPRPVLMHSSNRYPLGNCDSSRLETSLKYLTRLGAASISPLAAQFLFRDTDSARTLPEELVNPASGLHFLRSELRGAEPTSLAQPFPSHLGLSLENGAFFRRPPAFQLFQ